MNRIETKMVIMVTNRLAAAKDSDAKTEMIEELSENLYQRYLELTAEGMPEEEALAEAQESLGDVEELLAFLREEEGQNADTDENSSKEEGKEEKTSFFKDDLESGIEEIVNAAFSTARVAVDCARDMAKEVSDQLKDRYQERPFTGFSTHRGKKVDCTAIPLESVSSLELRLTNGNITISSVEPEASYVEITGDTEEIETMLRDDGSLSISQGNTASAAYFFMRGMRRSDLVLRLPGKLWDRVLVSTVNGDIRIEEGLECQELEAATTSGNFYLDGIRGSRMEVHSHSGDIHGEKLKGDFHGETKSGAIQINGSFGKCRLFSASGDVSFEGESQILNCSSTSGKVGMVLEKVPAQTKGSSISGSCTIKVDGEAEGFNLSYRTVSGTFLTNLPFAGSLGEKNGNAVYKEAGANSVQLSSVSGNLSICEK